MRERVAHVDKLFGTKWGDILLIHTVQLETEE
jgi:hypothetical protein